MRILEPEETNEHNAGHVEEIFLKKLKCTKQVVQIYLISGIKMVGIIKDFDDYTILISARSFGMQMLYKHSITTICIAHQEER